MEHQAPLITTIVAALGLAFVLGVLAQRLRISPLVGYLLAGVAMGPFTPGFVADQSLASQLAEIGVILLMFGVGLHFSLKDLLSVRRIAIPGAIAQMAVATLLGMGLAWLFGWSVGGGLVFGLALSVASTVVLIRALQERHLIDSEQGRNRARLADRRGPRDGCGPRPPAGRGRTAARQHRCLSRRRRRGSPRQPDRGHGRVDAAEGRSVRGGYAGDRPARHSVAVPLRRSHRLAGAVPAGGPGPWRSASPLARPSCLASPSPWARSSPGWCSANPS